MAVTSANAKRSTIFADVTAMFVHFKAIFTVHHAHDGEHS